MFFKKTLHGFYCASEGIVYSISTQRSMRTHIFAALLVLLVGMFLNFEQLDVLFIILIIGAVTAAETFNTAIEITVDLVTQEKHPLAKAAKDTAAGGVLLIVFIALIVGIVIIFPYFHMLIEEGLGDRSIYLPSFFAQIGLFIILFTYSVKAYWYKRNKLYQPHALIGILLFLCSLFNIFVPWLSYLLMVITLLSILFLIKTGYSWIGIVQNGMISIGGFYLLYWLFFIKLAFS